MQCNENSTNYDDEKLQSIQNNGSMTYKSEIDDIFEKANKIRSIQEKINRRISELDITGLNKTTAVNSDIDHYTSEIHNHIVENKESLYYIDNLTENNSNDLFEQFCKNDTLNSIDSRLITKKKTKTGLRFFREGVFIKREEDLNKKKLETRGFRRIADKFLYSNDITVFKKEVFPELEYWDLPFVRPKENSLPDEFPFEILESKINNLIEHPVPIEPKYDPNNEVDSSIILTPSEKAKLKRRRKQERELEKRDRIRMGLEPPPPPKLKLSNILNIYNDNLVSDPSKVELEIRKQVQERVQFHKQLNQERKLNDEERSMKKAKRWQLDPSVPIVNAAIFHLSNLSDKRIIFKIDKNAKDCHLTGCCVVSSISSSVVFVEGSIKSIKFYKNLLLNRIKWNECENKTECNLIWEGTNNSRKFKGWKLYYSHTREDEYKFFLDNKSLDIWNTLQNFI
ncbi:hypothetical protein FG386_000870 [Cryptosporidium ryanae]|uniref:uncharacterized protein n=1 Tax=Cryptosporidium ryanae TaxID=515981 RepID=UPI00351AAC01|nr:hypothetical protein FG386_000870 [Cryptosporidium ryanae]